LSLFSAQKVNLVLKFVGPHVGDEVNFEKPRVACSK